MVTNKKQSSPNSTPIVCEIYLIRKWVETWKSIKPIKDHLDNNDLLQNKRQLELFVKAWSRGTSKCDNK
jgi:hypothetical protein